eukprot:scaffold248139_cov19-Tisochrysis_lutea.AAC.1
MLALVLKRLLFASAILSRSPSSTTAAQTPAGSMQALGHAGLRSAAGSSYTSMPNAQHNCSCPPIPAGPSENWAAGN